MRQRDADPAFARATAAAAALVLGTGTLGTLWLRGWGRIGFDVPSVPWYLSFPFYVFPHPRLALGWAAGLWLASGYDPFGAVRAAHRAYQAAPGSAGRSLVQWLPGDLLAFGGMLGVPLLAALAARAVAVVRERALTSLDGAALATLLAAASWGFTKGEVERIFQSWCPWSWSR
jgi:hypothetical protein